MAGNKAANLRNSNVKKNVSEALWYDNLYEQQAQQAKAYQAKQTAAKVNDTNLKNAATQAVNAQNAQVKTARANDYNLQQAAAQAVANQKAQTPNDYDSVNLAKNRAEQEYYNDLYAKQAEQAKAYQTAQANKKNTNKGGTGGAPTITAEIPTVNTTPAQTTAPAQTTQQATIEIPTYTAPTIDIGTAPTAKEIPAFSSSLTKPTYQASTTEKPTYTSSYEKSTYTPQNYEAASYGGMGFSGRTYEGKTATFTPSQEYLDAMAETKRLLEQVKGGRTSFTDKINSKLEEIENTGPFQYDFNKDPLFQNALAAAMRSGQTAMQDTMGQAAALTGGYGSSYSQAVGNQAYNNYVQGAYDNLPEYYQMAYQNYRDDLQNKYNLLDEYRVADESEYQRMLNDYNNQFGYANDIYGKEYNKFWDETNFAENSRQWAENLSESSKQHAESLSAQTAMHAQSLSEQARQWAAEMNRDEARYADSLARADEQREYERYLNELNQWNTDRNFGYQQYLDELDQYNRDRSFEYGQYRDTVGDTRYVDETNYGRKRDALSDALRAEQTSYDRWRDSVGDARYAEETTYNRAETADNKAYARAEAADEKAYSRQQDAINNSLKASSNSLDWANYNLKKEAQQYEQEQATKKADAKTTSTTSETTLKEPSETQMSRVEKAYKEGGMDAVYKYVDTLPSNINTDMIMDYINQYLYQAPLAERDWSMSKNTFNWFGGWDGNDKVTDQYGNEYTLDELAKQMAAEMGISVKEAKNKLMSSGYIKK